MKKIASLTIFSIIAIISYISTVNSDGNDQEYYSQLTSANIEALANNESGTDHYWCCGTTDTCAKGPGYTIVGKLSDKPC